MKKESQQSCEDRESYQEGLAFILVSFAIAICTAIQIFYHLATYLSGWEPFWRVLKAMFQLVRYLVLRLY